MTKFQNWMLRFHEKILKYNWKMTWMEVNENSENLQCANSKLGYFSKTAKKSVLLTAQNQPKFQILFHKNFSPRDLYAMTLEEQ